MGNREIKFRAWHEYGKSSVIPAIPGMIYDENPGDCLHWKSQGQKITDIMQFTGMKDANGVDVYEGDLLDPEGGSIKQVVFLANEFGCGFKLQSKNGQITDMGPVSSFYKVVGNIHENKDMID